MELECSNPIFMTCELRAENELLEISVEKMRDLYGIPFLQILGIHERCFLFLPPQGSVLQGVNMKHFTERQGDAPELPGNVVNAIARA